MSLMLITAGYLNYTTNQNNVQTSTVADRSDEAIGDAEFVSTVPSDNEENKIKELTNGETSEGIDKDESKENLTPTSSINDTEKNKKEETDDYYFKTSKLERNSMFSETLEVYQEMYNNQNATTEAKTEALQKINNINNTKNAIMIAENLIVAKGFEDVVIFSNEDSISVVVKSNELKQEQVAQIQNIVSRELNVPAEKIHISNK